MLAEVRRGGYARGSFSSSGRDLKRDLRPRGRGPGQMRLAPNALASARRLHNLLLPCPVPDLRHDQESTISLCTMTRRPVFSRLAIIHGTMLHRGGGSDHAVANSQSVPFGDVCIIILFAESRRWEDERWLP